MIKKAMILAAALMLVAATGPVRAEESLPGGVYSATAARQRLKQLVARGAVVLTDVSRPSPDGPIVARVLLPDVWPGAMDVGALMGDSGHLFHDGFFPEWRCAEKR